MVANKRQQIRTAILDALASGTYKVGDKLPSENELIRENNISRATVREGLASLVQEGILSRRRGSGTYVKDLCRPSLGRRRLIAVLTSCPSDGDNGFGRLIRVFEKKVDAANCSLIVSNHGNDPEKAKRSIERLVHDGVSGVIFSPVQLPGVREQNLDVVRILEEHNVGFILTGTPISTDTLSRYSFIGSNGFTGNREMVRHLVRVGHRRIAFIRFVHDVYTADLRFSGFVEEMRAQGLDVPLEYVKELQPVPVSQQGQQEIRELMSLETPPTAVMCIHDELARNVIGEAQRMGLRVPEDIAVTGYDNLDFAGRMDPPLTTIVQKFEQEADAAFQILLAKMRGEFPSERQEFLMPELLIRASCGAPPEMQQRRPVGETAAMITH